MLTAIRERAKGWFAWLIVFALVVPLAFFGVYNYVTPPPATDVAQVNETKISSEQVRAEAETLRRTLASNFGMRPEQLELPQEMLRRQALENLITRTAARDFALSVGMRISDAALARDIQNDPSFHDEQGFSVGRYRELISRLGYTPQTYETARRVDTATSLLVDGLSASAFVTEAELQQQLELQLQQRELAYLLVSADALRESIELDEAQLKAFYEQNQQLYVRPEQVKVEYIELSRQAVAEQISVPDEEVRALYDEVKADRFTSGGQRNVRHILVTLPEGASAEEERAARTTLNEVRQKVLAGELSFEEAAKQYSQDLASAENGGDIGTISYDERGFMVEEVEEAALALDDGEISEPVRSQFGLHLIQAVNAQPPQIVPFEDVRDELRAEIAENQAENRFIDLANEMSNLVYEQSGSLEPAAEELGLQIKQSDWISRDEGEGIGADPGVREAAFSYEVLNDGQNSAVIQVGGDRRVALRVSEHRAEELLPLETVEDQVRAQLLEQRAAEEAKSLGDRLAEQLKAGESLDALAAANSGVEAAQAGFVSRDAGDLPSQIVEEAFRLPAPEEGQASYGSIRFPNGDYAVVRVSEVRQAPEPENLAERKERLRQELLRAKLRTQATGVTNALRNEAEIVVRESRL